ncbi:MAG: hypothetical protein MUC36_08150 [Planctomycetes bacterium]|jgi:hypothetical protein|nr:hypothetical protein [Planctomycetota bacterium]
MPARSRRRLILLLILGATVLPLGGAAVVGFRADASWQAMQAQTEVLRVRVAARDHHRVPLWGEAADGSAFAHYATAIELAHEVMASRQTGALLQASDAELAADQALRTSARPALGALRAGSRAAAVATPSWPGDRSAAEIVNLLHCRQLANLAMFETRARRHERAHLAAVQHSLDAAQFGADLLQRGLLINQMIGCAITAIAIDWPDAALQALDRPALDLLASGLERLDRRLPVALDHDVELLWLATNLQQVSPDPDYAPQVSSWRHGFSTRWAVAEAFTIADRLVRDLQQAQQLDWPQRQALIELECSVAAESPNPVVRTIVPNLTAAETNLRETVTLVRMLRMAVDLHRGLDVPPPRDPLGSGPIVLDRSGEELVLRSAGRKQLHRAVRPMPTRR